MTGDWKRWLTVTGAEHMCFIDSAVLQPQLGLPKAAIDGERAVAITRTYVTAFLDLHLKHKPAPHTGLRCASGNHSRVRGRGGVRAVRGAAG
ncbi:hypothetical protein ABT158_23330 [Nonomuraea sp. NPDC001636]|uniref:hypothetical protein n=1 Tax=Nonomuraea sp. NPDC001636 TaxID=3154391 RepID=UPI00331D5B1C